jgi:TetR/AcrR family transcriptional regulator, transcriptional repressor for nem operon
VDVAETHSPTKKRLLDAAEQLMLAKGFPATTVDEICDSAGFTKGSFFHYFENKEQLGKEVLDRFYLAFQQKLQQGSFREETDPLQRLYAYVERFIEMSKTPEFSSSCLLGNFTAELSETHPAIGSLCTRHFAEWTAAVKECLDQAKEQYAPEGSFDTQSLAECLIALVQGTKVLAKAKQNNGVFEQNLRHFKRYLRSLFETGLS